MVQKACCCDDCRSDRPTNWTDDEILEIRIENLVYRLVHEELRWFLVTQMSVVLAIVALGVLGRLLRVYVLPQIGIPFSF